VNPNESNDHKCEFCDKTFNTRQGKSKHQKICKLNTKLSTQCQPQNDPQMTQNDPQMTQNDPPKHKCNYCGKNLSKNCHLHRHLKSCKAKIKEESNEKKLQIMEGEMELQKKEIQELKEINRNMTKIKTQNNGTINYLNIHFNNCQPIEQFLDNLKNKFPLSIIDRKCLLDTYNECGIEAFADTFSIIMKKNQREQVQQGLLPTIPIVCTDSNLRSFKEFHEDGWKNTQSNSSIDKMIDISNDQILETENTKVFISQKERKKVHNRIKKDNTLVDMEKVKEKHDGKSNIGHQHEDVDTEKEIVDTEKEIVNTEKEIVSDIDIDTDTDNEEKDFDNYDFTNIDDELIEKYACIKLP